MTRINSGLKSSRPSAMDSARFRKSQSTIPVAKIGSVIGEADDALLLRVNRALALFLSSV